ncbi:hypothetical protein GGH12_004360 [Coemansia sp. RSA 1822]|nr:hypothetical protein GGH12_004360 [Coemansia sp. RSA 1822]
MQALQRAPWRRAVAATCSIQRCTRIRSVASLQKTADQTSNRANISTDCSQTSTEPKKLGRRRPLGGVSADLSQEPVESKELGRRRAVASASSKVSRYTQQHRGRQRIHRELLSKLDFEFQSEGDMLVDPEEADSTELRRHILVRELMSTVRQVGYAELGESDDVGDTEPSLSAAAAWDQYSKIVAHTDSATLLSQIPASTASLLICELNFMRAPQNYHHRFQNIVQVWDSYEAQGRPLASTAVFSMYLRALNMLGRHQMVLSKVARWCAPQGDKPHVLPISVMRQLILAYFCGNQPAKAMDLFYYIKAAPEYHQRITPHIYATVLRGVLQTKHLPNQELYILVEDLLQLLTQPAYDTGPRTGMLNELLQAACKFDNIALQSYVFERFLAFGVPVNNTTLGIMLRSSCGSNSDVRDIHSLYKTIMASESTRVRMSEHVFATFITAFVRAERADYALAVVRDLLVHPCWNRAVWHLHELFAYYADTSMAAQALDLFRLVDEDGVQPTWRVCTCVVSALSRGGQLPEHFDPQSADIDTLLTMGAAYGSQGHADRALDVFAELNSRTTADPLVFAVITIKIHQMISTYAERTGMGFRFEPTSSGLRTEHELLVATSCLSSTMDKLFALDMRMPQDVFHHAISAFILARDNDRSQHTYDRMVQIKQLGPTSHTFNVLLRAAMRSWGVDAAFDMFEQLRADSAPMHSITANILIHGLFEAQQPERAIDVYAYLVGRPTPVVDHAGFSEFLTPVPCDIYTFALLIRGLVQTSLVKEAAVVFEDAFSVLSQVPRQLLETFISALQEAGLFDVASACLKRYSKRVECAQNEAEDLKYMLAQANNAAPNCLPLSYFGYLLDKTSHDE